MALAAGVVQIPGVVAHERVLASNRDVSIGDARSALESADEAVAALPWAASPHAQRALVWLLKGDTARARSDIERAIELERTNWRHRVVLAQIEAAAGDAAAAAAALGDARRLSPRPGESFDALEADLRDRARSRSGAAS